MAALIRSLLSGAAVSGTPLLYATLAELVSERAGIVNLGLEGVMLMGAVTGFAVTASTGSRALGGDRRGGRRRRVQHDLRVPGDGPAGQPARERARPDVLRRGL